MKYILSPDCLNVEGYLRNTILDLMRQNYAIIPKWDSNINSIKDPDFFNFLIKEEYIIENLYKKINKISVNYSSPEIIETIILDNYFNINTIQLIHFFNIRKVALITNSINDELVKYIKLLQNKDVNAIEVHFSIENLDDSLVNKINNITLNYLNCGFVVYVKKNCSVIIPNQVVLKNTSFHEERLNIGVNKFFINFLNYYESTLHNVYHNKKVYVSQCGEVYNSIDKTIYLGNTKNPEMILSNLVKCSLIWNTPKTKISVCQDCEFRNMCNDSRTPMQNKNNELFYINECNYNPYIAKWEGEEGYKTLAECGVISDENGFSIDHEKIAEINKELWGE